MTSDFKLHVRGFFLGLKFVWILLALGGGLTMAAGQKNGPGLAAWTLHAQNTSDVDYKLAKGSWLKPAEKDIPLLLPVSIKTGKSGLRLESRQATIDLAPGTKLEIDFAKPDRLMIALESGGLIYDLQAKGRIEVRVADKARLVAEAMGGQPACGGGVLFSNQALIEGRNLQGRMRFTDLTAARTHDVDAGSLLCLDLHQNTVAILDDDASLPAGSAASSWDGSSTHTLRHGEIQVRNLQGTTTYTETGSAERHPVRPGEIYRRNLDLRKDSTRDDTQKINSLSPKQDDPIDYFLTRSPWSILAGGAVFRAPAPNKLGGGVAGAAPAQQSNPSLCLLIVEDPDKTEYRTANGPFIRPTQKTTLIGFPLEVRTQDVTACLRGRDYLLELMPGTLFQLDRPASERLNGSLERGGVFYQLQPAGTITIRVKNMAEVAAVSGPRIFPALPATGNVGGVSYRESVPWALFTADSPWVIGAAGVVASGIAGGISTVAVIDNHSNSDDHHNNNNTVSPSKPMP